MSRVCTRRLLLPLEVVAVILVLLTNPQVCFCCNGTCEKLSRLNGPLSVDNEGPQLSIECSSTLHVNVTLRRLGKPIAINSVSVVCDNGQEETCAPVLEDYYTTTLPGEIFHESSALVFNSSSLLRNYTCTVSGCYSANYIFNSATCHFQGDDSSTTESQTTVSLSETTADSPSGNSTDPATSSSTDLPATSNTTDSTDLATASNATVTSNIDPAPISASTSSVTSDSGSITNPPSTTANPVDSTRSTESKLMIQAIPPVVVLVIVVIVTVLFCSCFLVMLAKHSRKDPRLHYNIGNAEGDSSSVSDVIDVINTDSKRHVALDNAESVESVFQYLYCSEPLNELTRPDTIEASTFMKWHISDHSPSRCIVLTRLNDATSADTTDRSDSNTAQNQGCNKSPKYTITTTTSSEVKSQHPMSTKTSKRTNILDELHGPDREHSKDLDSVSSVPADDQHISSMPADTHHHQSSEPSHVSLRESSNLTCPCPQHHHHYHHHQCSTNADEEKRAVKPRERVSLDSGCSSTPSMSEDSHQHHHHPPPHHHHDGTFVATRPLLLRTRTNDLDSCGLFFSSHGDHYGLYRGSDGYCVSEGSALPNEYLFPVGCGSGGSGNGGSGISSDFTNGGSSGFDEDVFTSPVEEGDDNGMLQFLMKSPQSDVDSVNKKNLSLSSSGDLKIHHPSSSSGVSETDDDSPEDQCSSHTVLSDDYADEEHDDGVADCQGGDIVKENFDAHTRTSTMAVITS